MKTKDAGLILLGMVAGILIMLLGIYIHQLNTRVGNIERFLNTAIAQQQQARQQIPQQELPKEQQKKQ